MGFFGSLFCQSSRKSNNTEWIDVSKNIFMVLDGAMHHDPKMLLDQFARIVLHKNWKVGLALGKPSTMDVIGENDASFAFIREASEEVKDWVGAITQKSPTSQMMLDRLAQKLTRILMTRVTVVD